MHHTHKRRLPIEGLSETEEALLQMVITLTSQVSVLRERLDTVESLLEAGGPFSRDAIEGFAPSQEDADRRDALRSSIVAKVMQPIAAGLEKDIAQQENRDD
ncbi:hypothetical protein [Altererythrobacter sp. GH1-8]|uniref:hypothetical protein n=1 Tax=Altererythrobacter sp. GH1-8 TaxID=3349333 RepID=UPI00374C8DAD